MSLSSIFDISGSGMSAQSIRLNAISSNIANAESVGRTPAETYHAKRSIFAEIKSAAIQNAVQFGQTSETGQGVRVTDVIQSNAPLQLRYEPTHPFADKNGYVSYPNVNLVEEMTDMMSASRSMQTNIEVLDTAKTLIQKVLAFGQ